MNLSSLHCAKERLYEHYRVTNLTKYYGKARGIVNVSFSEEEGEIFGFIGPNGAGKSTTIRLLLSLIHPTSGSAKVFGKDVVAHGPEIRRDIGYLPSEVYYYEGMKVIDLLKYSASFYDCDCTQRMHELSEIMELEMNRRISDLSYGNKKKVGIVQGLLHSPKLLFLDEPTAGLDPLMQRKFFNLIRERECPRCDSFLLLAHFGRSAAFVHPRRHHPRGQHRRNFGYPHPAAEQLQEGARDSGRLNDLL